MDPLQAAMRPVASLLSRNIRETTPALELCREMDRTIVAINVSNTGLAAWFIVSDDAVNITGNCDDEPDVIVTGSLFTLASMAGQSGAEAIRDGSLELSGDARKAQQFQRLLSLAKPDIEEELSNVVGDVAAHRLGEIARGVGRWSRDARTTMGANIREYLQEESGDVPSRDEVERFAADVDTLRDDVERAEARLNRLTGDR
jgi:ubiquinone biosynthesis protein UbiJ